MHEPVPVAAKDDVTVFNDKVEKSACVHNDFRINRADKQKVTKYQDSKNALRESWKLNSIEAIPVIIGASGVMNDNLQRYLDSITGKH